MDLYIATFHTHLAALRSCNALKKTGSADARLAPVPRALSSSCGTCVMYQAGGPMRERMDADLEAIYRRTGDGYETVCRNED